MITVSTDLKIDVGPRSHRPDLLHKDSSEERLFSEIRKFLSQRGIKENKIDVGGGYALGRISTGGNDPDYSLMYDESGYWIVTHGERGRAYTIGLFIGEYSATNFFISQFIRPETIDWKAVFA